MPDELLRSLSLPTYEAGLLQSRAYRKLTVFLTTKLNENDLSLPEWQFAGVLHHWEGMRLQEIAEILNVEPPFATRLATSLQQKGYVTKVVDPSDSRAKLVTLTPAGNVLITRVEAKLRNDMKEYLTGITREELATYVSVLDKISRLP